MGGGRSSLILFCVAFHHVSIHSSVNLFPIDGEFRQFPDFAVGNITSVSSLFCTSFPTHDD